MKTALDIKMRQEQLREDARQLSASTGTEVRRDKRQAKQKLKLIKWMDKALSYAESSPQPEYVKQQIIMLQEKIKRADQRVFDELGLRDPKNPEVKKLIKAA